MELEISAGAGIEAELRTLHADAQQRVLTEHILALADQAGYGAALIDAVALGHAEAAVISWPQFAHMVRAAARGLSRRGLQQGDTAGIFVGDAVTRWRCTPSRLRFLRRVSLSLSFLQYSQ